MPSSFGACPTDSVCVPHPRWLIFCEMIDHDTGLKSCIAFSHDDCVWHDHVYVWCHRFLSLLWRSMITSITQRLYNHRRRPIMMISCFVTTCLIFGSDDRKYLWIACDVEVVEVRVRAWRVSVERPSPPPTIISLPHMHVTTWAQVMMRIVDLIADIASTLVDAI